MQKYVENTLKLMSFQSVYGNKKEIDSLIHYLKEYALKHQIILSCYQENKNSSPLLLFSNKKGLNMDVLAVGHLDVVPGDQELFTPKIKQNKIYGRGSLDMKAWFCVALDVLEQLIQEKSPIHFGILVAFDEEVSESESMLWFIQNKPISPKVVLDLDVAEGIENIVLKTKMPVFVELKAFGKSVHGMEPWKGQDAIEKLMQTIYVLRKKFPYYASDFKIPKSTWISTMHVGKISGGVAENVVSGSAVALLDFRLTEKMPFQKFESILKNSCVSGVEYTIKMKGTLVNISKTNPFILQYFKVAKKVLGYSLKPQYIGGATDTRFFYDKGCPVIMHSGSGLGMHGKEEYCTISSMEQLVRIYKEFISNLYKK